MGGYIKNSLSTTGAIYCRYVASIIINDGLFKNNASENGGVIYLDAINSSNYAELTINGGTFNNNSAINGGVVYSESYVPITINNGTFKNNSATNGGVIFTSGKITLAGGVFSGNIADAGATIFSSNTIEIAGAEFINLQIKGIELKNDTVDADLTGIKLNGGSTATLKDVTISGVGYSTGIQNSANLTINANISNCASYLIKNLLVGTLTITGGTYKGRDEIPTANNNIIGIYNEGILYANGGTVENCSSLFGAGIYSINGSSTFINGTTIKNCYTSDYGTGIYLNNSTLNMDSGTITNNTSAQGGAIYAAGSTINITGGTISNNTANAGVGGAIWLTNTSILNISGGIFNSNTSSTSGGAIYAMNGNTLNVTGGMFSNNSSVVDGGAIFLDNIVANINATFECNSSANGGAVKAGINADTSNKIGGTFIANTATETGGAIALYDGAYAKIIDSIFTNYKDDVLLTNSDGSAITNAEYGGAIYIGTGATKAEISGGEFNGLVASNGGGAIANMGNLEVLGISVASTVKFTGCQAQIGGAIANSVTATRSGLSVNVVSATAEIKFVTFTQNVATQGETNAIANIGNLTISGSIAQEESNQDISNSKITILGIKTVYGTIAASPTLSSLTVSYSKASLNDLTDLTNVEFDMTAAGSTTISGVTTINEFDVNSSDGSESV